MYRNLYLFYVYLYYEFIRLNLLYRVIFKEVYDHIYQNVYTTIFKNKNVLLYMKFIFIRKLWVYRY